MNYFAVSCAAVDISRRSRIFLRRGPFRVKCQVAAIQWGGGSSRNVSWSPNADAIQWGGGGSSRNFRSSPEADAIQWGGASSRNFRSSPKADAIQWGGVVAEIFGRLRESPRFQWGKGSTMHFSLMGPFYIFGIFKRGPPF